MGPFYKHVCERVGWAFDKALHDKLVAANEEELRKLEATIEDSKKNLGACALRGAGPLVHARACRVRGRGDGGSQRVAGQGRLLRPHRCACAPRSCRYLLAQGARGAHRRRQGQRLARVREDL